MNLSDIGESGLIERIKSLCESTSTKNLVIGIGDDCAAFRPAPGFLQIVTTDALVEGVHFLFDYFSPRLLGKKSITINLSDIAAMGGIPRYALISLQIPAGFSVESLENFYKGAIEVTEKYHLKIIGGNITSSISLFSAHITIIGEVESEKMVSRNHEQAGDSIYVTGTLGNAAAGLEIIKMNGRKPEGQHHNELIKKYLSPVPRLREGRILAEEGIASAMIDVSDGIASELRRICTAKGLGARVYKEKIPVSESLITYASEHGKNLYNYALYGGEDYELLFTVNSTMEKKICEILHGRDISVTLIGLITAEEKIMLVNKNDEALPLEDKGFDHFRNSEINNPP